ncbi:MAG TPA: cation transporter [Gemmatimonadales bacterium]
MDQQVRYRVLGMDCAADAAEIERAVRTVSGVEAAKVSAATQLLTVRVAEPAGALGALEAAVTDLGYRLVAVERPGRAAAKDTHVTPAYRRALWTVVLLNVGYGVVEMGGGFLSGSQAVKADALDFLGDGLITFLGLLAIGWTLGWRARAALIQGGFLGLLGLGVLGNTAYRVWAQQQPEFRLMGILGLIALAVNVASALVLIPHRTGDANVRAVWLFSRNDAIGNAAVVAAAGLVAWTGTPWPDLVVAVAIAGLFLHSSWAIVRDAVGELGGRAG